MNYLDEEEPDLGDVTWGSYRADKDEGIWDVNTCVPTLTKRVHGFFFTGKEDLMASTLFQEALSGCLVHKDNTIRALQEELLALYYKVQEIKELVNR